MKKLTSKTKKWLLFGALVLTICFGVFAFAVYSIYSFFNRIGKYDEAEIPAAIREAKVYKGEDFLTKREFYKLDASGVGGTIAGAIGIKDERDRQKFIESQSAKDVYGFDDIKICGNEIVAVGRFGAFFFDRDGGNFKKQIIFEPFEVTLKVGSYEKKQYKSFLDELKIIELNARTGECGFITHGYQEGAAVYDQAGKRIFDYGADTVIDTAILLNKPTDEENDKRIFVTDASAADLDGDGAPEIIVSRKNDGVRTFDLNKKELRFQPDEFPTASFKMVDTDGDGTSELVEFQGVDSTVRDKQTGKVLRKLEIDQGWRKDFLPGDNEKKAARLFEISDNKISISDLSGKILLTGEAPLSEIKVAAKKYDLPRATPTDNGDGTIAMPVGTPFVNNTERVYKPRGVWVRLKKEEPKYLAVVGAFIGFPRAQVYVYDARGNLVYQELLGEKAEAIAAAPASNSAEEILITGKDKIWRFAAR